MKEFRFSQEKNEILKSGRKISFEDVIEKIRNDRETKAIKNPNKEKYPNQKLFLVKTKKHIYVIPFVEEKDYIFLKTIYPSNKYTNKLLKVKK